MQKSLEAAPFGPAVSWLVLNIRGRLRYPSTQSSYLADFGLR
jgi:hypothetical protein